MLESRIEFILFEALLFLLNHLFDLFFNVITLIYSTGWVSWYFAYSVTSLVFSQIMSGCRLHPWTSALCPICCWGRPGEISSGPCRVGTDPSIPDQGKKNRERCGLQRKIGLKFQSNICCYFNFLKIWLIFLRPRDDRRGHTHL